MSSEISAYLPQIFASWLFRALPQSQYEAVAAKLTCYTFRPGEALFVENELPGFVYFIVQGRVRVLGAALYGSPTLTHLDCGEWVGWSQLIRRVAVGSAQAAIDLTADRREVMAIALSSDDFEMLAIEHLLPTLAQHTDVSELFDVLTCYRTSFPTQFNSADIRALVAQILKSQQVQIVTWRLPSGELDSISPQLASDSIWFVSGGAPVAQAVGSTVDRTTTIDQQRESLFPLRLLGIDQSAIASLFSANRPSEFCRPQSASSLPVVESVATFDRVANEFPSGQMRSSRRVHRQLSAKSYPVKRSRSPDLIEDTVACFTMLYAYLKVPFQPDSLRQWLHRLEATQTIQLELCGRIAEVFNVSTKTVRFTPTAQGINRMDVPALIAWRDGFAVLYEVSPTAVIVGAPREGLLTLSPQQIAGNVPVDPETQMSRGLVLERTVATASKRFGLSWFLPSISRYRWTLIQVLIASVFVQILGLANPLIIQQIFDKVIVSGNAEALPVFGMLLIIFSLFEAILNTLRTYLFVDTTNRIDLTLGTAVIRQLLNLPLSYFEQRTVGQLSARIAELENIRQFLTGGALTVVLDALFAVLYIVVMLFYSVQLTIVALFSVPIVIVTTLFVSPLLQHLIQTRAEQNADTQSYLVEILSGIFTVKAQNIEGLARATWRERYVKYVSTGFKAIMLNTAFSSFSTFINTLSGLVVLWYGASLVVSNELSLGGLIAFRIIAGYVTGPLLRLAQLWERFQEVALSMSLIADVVDSAGEISPIDQAQVFMPTIRGSVRYEDLSFGFNPGQLQLLNINLKFAEQTFIGIVGQSGSGKSTLTKLLPRLYLPNTGRIFIDGYDISKVHLNSLRSQIGIVPQDAILFQGTIRDNITQFCDGSDDEVISAAQVAAAHDFIMSLENGYSTQVGERGGSLSGGQRQRIAIARMVFQNPRLLILDEATSALDYTTEREVCQNLQQRFRDRTVFFITHRLSTIRHADTILLMQSGVVAEQGTHEELMDRRQLYYLLYCQQAQSPALVD